jgi:uncharacterized protein YdeI (YjbR/CyaY-like superfamily)
VQSPDGKPVLSFAQRSDWAEWLDGHHGSSSGAWLQFKKKGSSGSSVTYSEAVEVALCYGWIDGQGRSGGEEHWLVKFTPRSKRSIWSKRNREKVLALIASGEMQPPGLAEVERALADGRWDAAYDSPSQINVPEDLEAALVANPAAKAFFEGLDSRNRYTVLFRIQTAQRPQTREKRIQDLVEKLAKSEKPYP